MALNPYKSPGSTSLDVGQTSVVRPLGRPFRHAGVVVSLLPMISYVYAVLFWLVASVTLGEWARPGVHDPKSFLFGVPLYLHVILMALSFSVAPFACVIGYRCGRFWQYALTYAACLALSIVLFSSDIFEVSTWIAD